MSRAVTALRDADNSEKPALLRALRASSCEVPEVCSVRSACLSAYELHVEAMGRAAALAGDASDAAAAASGLAGVERDLARAKELAGSCTDLQGELIRRYRL